MGERWNWDCGVEGEVADSPEQMTLTAHKKIWKRFLHYSKCEAYRMRGCYGCIYLRAAGDCLCCSHLLVTNKRRPQKNEDGSCRGRKEIPGFVKDEAYERFLRDAADFDEAIGKNAHTDSVERKRPIAWDAAYAHGLYQRDFSLFEIAKIMDIKYGTVTSYARYHKWLNPTRKVRTTHNKSEIEAEIRAYKDYQAKGRTATTE